MRIVPALCFLCWATVPTNGLFGQVPRLEFGTRVRVTAPSIEGSPFLGVVISVDESSLILDVADDRTPAWSVWLDAVESLEVSLGSHANTWKGMGLGALGGGLLGAGFMGIVCAVEGGCDADGATTRRTRHDNRCRDSHRDVATRGVELMMRARVRHDSENCHNTVPARARVVTAPYLLTA